MAGSYDHCATESGTYRGANLLENMGDATEAVEEMFFMVGYLAAGDRDAIRAASNAYFRCLRNEEPWPEYMRPGVERD